MSTLNAAMPAATSRSRAISDPAVLAGWVVLLAALAISIGPFVYLVSLSLMDNRQIFNGTVLAWPWRLENYPEAWVATKIGVLYWNSLYVSTVSMVLTVAISALAGYGARR